jgi:hypothetical protein
VVNPLTLLWWSLSPEIVLVIVGVLALAIIVAVAVFGGGWS